MNSIELKNLAGGAVQEQFARAFEKVVANLQDPNTPYKSGREITIKLKFEQNERRDDVKCAVSVSEKLAPQAPMATSFAVGTDLRSGQLFAREYGNQCLGQISIDEALEQGDEIESIDKETGEIKVVDLRKNVH